MKSTARNPRSEIRHRKALNPEPRTPNALGKWLQSERERLLGALDRTDAFQWMAQHTHLIDLCLQRLFDWAWQRAWEEIPLMLDEPLAIIATGGYGRSELAPYSDIDLTFVPLQDGDPFTDRLVKHLFHAMMETFHETAGLKIGYAYRLMDDLASLDAKTRTGLLDRRLIAGSKPVYRRFEEAFQDSLDPVGFLFERYGEYQARLAKYGESALRSEPDLKEGAGGQRDFHTACWMTQVRYNVSREQVLTTLVQQNLLTVSESEQVAEAYKVLCRLRLQLHESAGQARDSLMRPRQDEMALRTGFQTNGGESDVPAFMEHLLRQMHSLHTLCDRVIETIIRSRLPLDDGLASVNLELVPADPACLQPLHVFGYVQQYGLTIGQEVQKLLREKEKNQAVGSRQWAVETPSHREIGSFFRSVLAVRGQVYRVLRLMADLDVLQWVLPELGNAFYLVPPDPTHEYSVGEHSLQAVRVLDSLWNEPTEVELTPRMPFEEISRPEVLYLALLLHDAGKLNPQRSHSEAGAEIAREVCLRWGWDERTSQDVEFLVREHLLMAQTARQRDLHLPETIRDFTRTVDDLERLQMLYLLTYADTRAVGERIWTPAQASFVHELYRRAAHALYGEEPGVPDLTHLRKRVLRDLSKHPFPPEVIEEHIQQMPASYLLNVPLEQITLHIHYVERALQGEPAVEFHNSPQSPYTEMTVCTPDDPKPGLLSKIAGVLYAAEVAVHGARVITRENETRIALDTLWVDYRGRPLSPTKCALLERDLRAVLTGEHPVEEVLRGAKKAPETRLQVYRLAVHDDVSERYTVVDFQTPTDAGVLYRAARTLSSIGWNIHSARLGQWAGRTVVSFYVTDTHGNKISPECRDDLRSQVDWGRQG